MRVVFLSFPRRFFCCSSSLYVCQWLFVCVSVVRYICVSSSLYVCQWFHMWRLFCRYLFLISPSFDALGSCALRLWYFLGIVSYIWIIQQRWQLKGCGRFGSILFVLRASFSKFIFTFWYVYMLIGTKDAYCIATCMSHNVRKRILEYVHPTKIQIRPCICAFYQNLHSVLFGSKAFDAKEAKFLFADNKDSAERGNWSGSTLFATHLIVFDAARISKMELTNSCLVSNKGALANNVDPDQTPQNAASGQGLHCLH